jgi:hypothetical protein
LKAMTDEKKDPPSAVNSDDESAKGAEGADPGPAPLFDAERLLRVADWAARFGLSPADLLAEAVRAEGMLPETERSLASLVENNDPSRTVDIFESPTFRRRLRELRVWARTVGVGPETYVILPEDLRGGTRTVRTDLDQLGRALKELKAIGRALSLCGPNPPERRKVRFEEMVLLQNEDGSSVLDDEGLPKIVSQKQALERGPGQWLPVSAVERNCLQFTGILRRAIQESKRLRNEDEILTALEKGNGTPPTFRLKLAALLAEQRTRFPGMRATSIALCWAFGTALDPSTADRLGQRRADREKKISKRGGRSARRNVP